MTLRHSLWPSGGMGLQEFDLGFDQRTDLFDRSVQSLAFWTFVIEIPPFN